MKGPFTLAKQPVPEQQATRLLLLLVLAWIFPGLVGHEPWKPDEAYTIGLISHMSQSGDWVVPSLTGEPFMEKPPVFYITAALFGKLLSPWLLPLHQAAALAAAFYLGLLLYFAYRSGCETGNRATARTVVFCLIGCIGLIERSHSAITDVALWCGASMSCYGFLLSRRRLVAGAFWLGTGCGLAFMAKGLQWFAFIVPALVLLPVFCSARRNRQYLFMLAWALLFALPWLCIWPAALYLRSPELFSLWFIDNNFGRFLGQRIGLSPLATTSSSGEFLANILWFSLPLWPPILTMLWQKKRVFWREEALVFPALIVLSGMLVLAISESKRQLYMIPLLFPLAIMAAQTEGIPQQLQKFMTRAGILLPGILLTALLLLWITWISGHPAALHARIEHYAPGLNTTTGPLATALACIYALCWAALCLRLWRHPHWPLAWASGATMVWGVFCLLFMPLLDYTKSYYATFMQMNQHIPAHETSLGTNFSRGFGESQRALLEYYLAKRVLLGKPQGNYFLALHSRDRPPDMGGEWIIAWEGARPGDQREWYTLYRRRLPDSQKTD